jgi:hypothetical protein
LEVIMFNLSKKILVAVVAAALAALAGGIAYASIPDSNSVIHGCYLKTGGILRVVDTNAGQACSTVEKPLTWNQRGGSDGWDAQLNGTVPTGGSDVQLSGGANGIPPGSYLVSGSVSWPALDSGSAYLFCNLVASGTDLTGSTSGGFGTASTAGGGTVAMNGAITVQSGTANLGVECRENSGTASVPVAAARVHAIQVATLH